MNTINIEILKRKITFLFFKNPKKVFNIKQINSFAAVRINERELYKILYSISRQNYINYLGRGKFTFNRFTNYQIGKILKGKKKIINLETSMEYKITKSQKTGFFPDDIVYYHFDKRERIKIASLKRRELKKYVGTIKKESGLNILKNTGLDTDIIVKGKCEEDEIVTAHITDWKYTLPEAKILKIIGNKEDTETQIHAILEEFGLPSFFSKSIENEARNISKKVKIDDNRIDLRNTLTFTIDPEDAKDFDDALSFKELKNNNMEVGIHISDVTHYVKENTLIDDEAKKRGTSVYLTDRVVPMLPETLSNDLCSLNPNQDKNVFSVIVVFDKQYKITDTKFIKSTINSNERMSYDEVQYILNQNNTQIPAEISVTRKNRNVSFEVESAIKVLNSIAVSLKKKRQQKGSVFFNKEEVKFIVENGEPVEYKIKKQKQANYLIEEFMLLANVMVARKIKENNSQAVFRIHDYPDEEKIVELEKFAKNLGYQINISNRKNINEAINNLLKKVENSPEKNVVDMMIIRSMSKAKYSTNNIGHFGLGFADYTHFTSPIRRYPDIIVHRLLNSVLSNKTTKLRNLESICIHCSRMEETATKAERSSIKMMQVKYMSKKINTKFEAIVSGIIEKGVFVEIKGSKCEGLVKMKDIPNDYYVYDATNLRAVGQHTHEEYSLGDEVLIKVLRTDLDKKQIDFKILEKKE